MQLKLVLEHLSKKKGDEDDEKKVIDLNPNQALGDNDIMTLEDQNIEQITNKGGIATIMTPAGILTVDSKKRGW